MVNKTYCASSYLMFRMIAKDNISFCESMPSQLADILFERTPVSTGKELLDALTKEVLDATAENKAALALSGGIDSAVLARLMPPGSTAYTFRCCVPGVDVIDETAQAAKYAQECGLRHKIISIRWEDVIRVAPLLMRNKGAPIHSIEAQIYLAACQAKEDGFSKLIFGENADIIYGGMDGLLAKDWTFGEFVDRYSYVMPYKVLRNYELILEPYKEFEKAGFIDAHEFINLYFRREALGTYNNACDTAGVKFIGPYSKTQSSIPLDLARIRNGESKYVVREVFQLLFPGYKQPPKIPMPRPMDEWMSTWTGPTRPEFWPHCTDHMTGDQKWMVWALEKFLDLIEKEEL